MTQPTIEGHPADVYMQGVQDNGRALFIMGDHPRQINDLAKAAAIAIAGGYDSTDTMSINNSAHGDMRTYNATMESANCGNHPNYPLSNIHERTCCIGLRCGCESPRINHTISMAPAGGTSALFACVAGLWLGYKTIYLCGVRLEKGTIYHDENIENNWKTWQPILSPHVTVMGDSWLAELINGGKNNADS